MTFSPAADRPPLVTPAPFPIRPEASATPPSGIAEVFAYGQGRQGLLALWVGESDVPTSPAVAEAAARSVRDGETFYPGGIAELVGQRVFIHYDDGEKEWTNIRLLRLPISG